MPRNKKAASQGASLPGDLLVIIYLVTAKDLAPANKTTTANAAHIRHGNLLIECVLSLLFTLH